MSDRKSLFVSHFKVCADAAKAAALAGYSPRSAAAAGRRLLADPAVRRLIDAPDAGQPACREEAESAPVSVDWVVREAKRTYDAAHEAGSLSTAVSCLNLIGKHLEARAVSENSPTVAGVTVVTGIEGAPASGHLLKTVESSPEYEETHNDVPRHNR